MPAQLHGVPRALVALALIALVAAGAVPVLAAQLDESSYESPNHGYLVEWGSGWAVRDRETSSAGGVDTLVLTNNDGRLEIFGREDGTADEYLVESLDARDADAEVLREDHESDVPTVELIAGRYHVLYQAYTLEGAVVVVRLQAREADYPAALALAQAEVTINGSPILSDSPVSPLPPGIDEPTEEATEDASPVPVASPYASPVPSGETGLDGNTFTSPGFGFTLEIPADWTIEEEAIAEGDERLVISNGTSTITLHATSLYQGDLEGCIGWERERLASDPAHVDLRLAATATGDAFQGSDDRSAYALFRYTGEGETEMAIFTRCQHIVEGESVLILTQDVPFDSYASERAARRQIQNAIDFP